MEGDAKFFGQVLRAIRLNARPEVTKAGIAAVARCRVEFVDAVEEGFSVPGDRTIRSWLRACGATDRAGLVIDIAETARKAQRESRS